MNRKKWCMKYVRRKSKGSASKFYAFNKNMSFTVERANNKEQTLKNNAIIEWNILISYTIFMAISPCHDGQVPSPTICVGTIALVSWYTSPPRVAKIFEGHSKYESKSWFVTISHAMTTAKTASNELSTIKNNKLMHERTPSSIECTHTHHTRIKIYFVRYEKRWHAVHCVLIVAAHTSFT